MAERKGTRLQIASDGGSSPPAPSPYHKGPISQEELSELIAEGRSRNEIAHLLGRSPNNVSHWLGVHGLASKRHRPVDRSTKYAIRWCRRHGDVRHRLTGPGYRCVQCSSAHTRDWKLRRKQQMVDERGGCCERCGYRRCLAALEFHHRDPASKLFSPNRAWRFSLDKLRAELAKCDLFCANCHREVEDDRRRLLVAKPPYV
jgi:DNA-directed RNA polymerase subunit RPC12/RpoP